MKLFRNARATKLFMDRVEKTDSCWLWKLKPGGEGYGEIQCNPLGIKMTAHRFSYEIFKGPIPKGKWVLHHCDVRLCVNPQHLYAGTAADNNRDTKMRGRTCRGKKHPAYLYPDFIKNGEENPNAKLTEKVILEMFRRIIGGEFQKNLAKEYGINRSLISAIIARRLWRHSEKIDAIVKQWRAHKAMRLKPPGGEE